MKDLDTSNFHTAATVFAGSLLGPSHSSHDRRGVQGLSRVLLRSQDLGVARPPVEPVESGPIVAEWRGFGFCSKSDWKTSRYLKASIASQIKPLEVEAKSKA